LFGKHNWICKLRRQDLTRKSSGNRHNSNLHARSAKLVRPYDYVIGRLNGEIALLQYMIHCYIEDTRLEAIAILN
jgi:hypothetical protein